MLRFLLVAALLQASSAIAGDPNLSGPAAKPAKPLAGTNPPAQASATHHWYDGDRRRGLRVDERLRADFPEGKAVLTERPARTDKSLDGTTIAEAPADSPVFRDADSPAVKRALPGGVILTTRGPTDAASLERLLAGYGLSVARQLDADGIRWLVETAPGMAGLELANRLHESGEFAAAAPNWWRERALK